MTPEEIIAHCQKELARFKVPKDVVITEIPKPQQANCKNSFCVNGAKERV